MPSPLKVAGLVGTALSIISAAFAGIYFYTNSSGNLSLLTPKVSKVNWSSISNSRYFQEVDNGSHQLTARRYSLFFVAPVSYENEYGETVKTKDWWDESYALWQQEKAKNSGSSNNFSTQFQNITSSYSETTTTTNALNQVCKKHYEEDDSFFENSIPKESTFINDFWKFCSHLKTKPVNLVEANEHDATDASKINHSHNSAYYLAATGEGKNDRFWEIKDSWFYKVVTETPSLVNEEVLEYVKKHQDTIGDFSLRKFCALANRESINSGDIKEITVLKHCSYFDFKFEIWFE